jgi:lipopolysaccharide export system permease protein
MAMFGSGVSLRRLVLPLVALGALLSAALFLFENEVAIHTLRMKNQLYRTALDIRIRLDDANVAVATPDRRTITHADFYDDERVELSRVLLLERAAGGRVTARIDAERARWDGSRWILEHVRRFTWDDDGHGINQERFDRYPDPGLLDEPDVFRREQRDVNEMQYRHALEWVQAVRAAGGEYRAALARTYGKISFAFTPLLVTIIAAAVGGLLRKNVLLLSVLAALGLAVVFFVLRMVGETLARVGVVSPPVGAFAGVALFLAVGLVLLQAART